LLKQWMRGQWNHVNVVQWRRTEHVCQDAFWKNEGQVS